MDDLWGTMRLCLFSSLGLLLSVAVQAEMLTSTACPSLRWAVYPARLDLFYFYLIEFANTTTPDLSGIERAIASALIDTFRGCNAYGEPVHGVQLNKQGHRFSSGGEFDQAMTTWCVPIETENLNLLLVIFNATAVSSTGICSSTTPGDECRVVRGLTSILLDTSADGVADIAYTVMEEVLADLPNTDEFLATPLIRAEFVRPIGENLVLQQTDDDDSKANNKDDDESHPSSGAIITIAAISAVTAFVLTALFFCGLSRSQNRKEEEKDNMRLAYYHAKRRKFWSQLQEEEDQHTYPGLMMTEPAPMHTVTWSVSDLTSESASIKSALKMDRIDEEYEGGSNESQAGEEDLYEEAKAEDRNDTHLPRPSLEIPPFIAHWQDDHSEMATRGSNLPDRVWELATMPKSYWDESDPEAPTPDHSPVGNFRSPTGCAYLQDDEYDEENSFADHELNLSSDSQCKLPAVTYTTEEEEYSQGSSPTDSRRQSEPLSEETFMMRPLQSFDPSDDDPVTSEEEILDSPGGTYGKNVVMTYRYTMKEAVAGKKIPNAFNADDAAQERKKSMDPDPVMTFLQEKPAVSEEETPGSSPASKGTFSDESIEVEDDEESASTQDSSGSGNTRKDDVFYTPKQDVSGGDSLKSVAQTIIREAHVYDEATQKWARQVLEEMQSPKPKLLAASPHDQ